MTTKNTLREEICKIFGVSPEELEYNLPGGIGLEKCQQLEVLISDVVAKAEREAYKKGYIDGGIGVINEQASNS